MSEDQHQDGPRRDALALPAQAALLPQVSDWLLGSTILQDAPEGLAGKLDLVVEELFLNLANHAYADGEGEVRLALIASDRDVTLQIEDDGAAFDPLASAPEPDLDMEIDERAIGGLGLHLIRSLSDAQTYERTAGVNRLTLVFRTVPAEDPSAAAAPAPTPTPRRKAPGLHAPSDRERKGVFFAFFLRILLPVAAIMTASLIMAAGLNVLRLERAFQDAAQIRYDSVARELSDTIASSFGAGLSLGSNQAIQVAIDRSEALHDSLIRFYVTDPEGRTIYASAGGAATRPDSFATALAGMTDDQSDLRHGMDDETFLTAAPLLAGGGEIGTLLLVFPSQDLFEVTADLRREVASAAPVVALISLPLIGLIALLIMIPFDRRFQHQADGMHDMADGLDRPLHPRDGPLLRAADAIALQVSTAEAPRS
ncbi:ATP-binding protein [Pseudooceanicola algae]|uniref:Histidine kinase/HSP90-like ATPase domain-containing protein n=1 Tax=Pseudooceanicola algae TaxID=1537215 RepID=A0A418SHR6_9RHOB|nr:ATP-binding protein [Pseudooceanicola algae]QPM90249.1 hypothetical protein PSAL_014840 [Pseudooceanicola algae]